MNVVGFMLAGGVSAVAAGVAVLSRALDRRDDARYARAYYKRRGHYPRRLQP